MKQKGMNNTVVNALLRCMPIALQLSGACVVINAMSLVGSIDDILNHAKVIATIPHDKSKRIYLNKEMVEASIEKNVQQTFSAIYIVAGYLSAVIMADMPPSGWLDAAVILAQAFLLWILARVVSNRYAKINAERIRSVPSSEKTKGVIAYKNAENNSVIR